VVVTDTFGMVSKDIELDPEDPISFMAQKASKMGFIKLGWAPNETSKATETMANLAVEYQANCVIVLAHWSCRQYCGTIKLLRDAVAKQAGVPFLTLDGDLLDPRVVSSATMKQKIGEFLNLLESRTASVG
ncbi:MAG: 2-hydroxyacyl-CoA dehydratase family protein, partial [Candidatus Binatia bacterium]|nr:2-hydroxyacyl-CoA dehydratase family protein [Candidatus Binatia bacterium]